MTVTTEVLAPGDLTLDELASEARDEHLRALEAAESALGHAIRSGAALLEAKKRVPHGNWLEWIDKNFPYPTAAWIYMRLAWHREAVLASGADSIAQAREAVKGLPQVLRYSKELREDARLLRASGLSIRKTAQALGVSGPTIVKWTDPEKAAFYGRKKREYMRNRHRATRALERAERDQCVKQALVKQGQAMNEAYVLVNKLDQLLGQARAEATTDDSRRHINEAHAHRDKMMDALVKALGVS